MRSTFFGLELGRLGLWAQQRALDVTGHNIANANTEGYSRQVARLRATPAYAPPARTLPVGAGQVGTGVEVAGIDRITDLFLDRQVRDLKGQLGRWDVRARTLAELETLIGEPSESGLAQALNEFWEALSVVANRPDSLPARAAAIEQARTLVERFQTIDRQLADLQRNLDASVVARVDRINQIVDQLGDLHRRIRVVQAAGQSPNDLLDERDRLLEELATLLPIRYAEREPGVVRVEVAGLLLVDGEVTYRLQVQEEVASDGSGLAVRVYWQDGQGGSAALDDDVLAGGELDGLLEARHRLVGGLRQDVRQLFFALADEINRVHRSGYGLNDSGSPNGSDGSGRDFFVYTDPTDLQSVRVNQELDDPANFAAAQAPGAPGDGRKALELAALRNTPLPALGDATVQAYLEGLVAELGIAGRQAESGQRTTQLVLEQALAQRESIRGVSLDEEMTNLVRFQHAYAAAGRFITAVDQLLSQLIERTGLVGR